MRTRHPTSPRGPRDPLAAPAPDADLDAACEAQFVDYFPQFRGLPGIDVHDGPDLATWETGADSPVLNGVARSVLGSGEADRRIEEVVGRFRAKQLPMVWTVTPSVRPTDTASRLASRGLADSGALIGMVGDLEGLFGGSRSPGRPPRADASVREVTAASDFHAWIRPAARSFELSPSAADTMFRLHTSAGLGRGAALRHFVAWVEGSPLACSTLFLHAGVAGIFNVGTDPGARRRGLGTAVTVAALGAAWAAGYRFAVLHSTVMGLSVYEKLGFRERFRIGLFTLAGAGSDASKADD